MSKTSQRRAIERDRKHPAEQGMARFEVIGRDTDRDLIRAVARRLAEGGADADRLRSVVRQALSGEPRRQGGILDALLASPLAGSDPDLARSRGNRREADT